MNSVSNMHTPTHTQTDTDTDTDTHTHAMTDRLESNISLNVSPLL